MSLKQILILWGLILFVGPGDVHVFALQNGPKYAFFLIENPIFCSCMDWCVVAGEPILDG